MEWRPKGGWRSQVRLALPSSARPTPAETLIYYLSHSKLKGITAERAERTDGRTDADGTDGRTEGGKPRLPRCAFSPPSVFVQGSVSQSVRVAVCMCGAGSEQRGIRHRRQSGEGKLLYTSIHPSIQRAPIEGDA